jgi:LemA protein
VAGLIVVIVIVVLLVILGLWAAGVYNGLVRLRNLVQEAWRQIDVELRRRHDLIPNLVETVKGYASHERQTLDAVVAARAAAVTANGSMQQQAEQEGALSAALGRLFAVAEAYPNLKANHNFLALQTELTETEDRVAAGRRFYNANVRELNTRVESFPSNLFAGVFHFARAEYFEIADAAQRAVPQVGFGGPASPLPASPASPGPTATTAPGAEPPYGTPG